MEELHKKLLHWMMVERSDRTKPWICFDDGGGGDGGGGDGGGGDGGDGGGDDGDDDDDDGGEGEAPDPAEPDPEANFDFSPTPSLEPGVTVELSAAAQGRGDVEDATIPEPAAPPEPTPPEETPEITLPEITVLGSQPSEKETQEKEEGPPNAAPSSFGNFANLDMTPPSVFDLPAASPTGREPTLEELYNDLTKEPSPAPSPAAPAPSPPGIFENALNAVTASIMGQAHAATPVSQDIIQQDQVYDPFGTRDEGKEQDRIEPSVPGAVPPEAFGKSEALEKEAASKEQDPFDIQNAAFNTFGVNPGFFGAQPVEPSAPPAALAGVPGMPQEVAAPQPAQQEQTSTPKDDPLNTSMTPTPVATAAVPPGPVEQAQFGTRAEKKDDDPFGTPEVFNLEMPSAPQAQFDLNTPNPSAPQPATPFDIAQAPSPPQGPPSSSFLFDPTPMNPPSPAPPVEVAQAPLGKSDRENPSTREFDPTIFDPATFAPSAQPAPPVEVAQTPPSQVTSFAPQPGQQPGLPSAVTGVPSGVPSGVPGGTPDIGGAGPVVTLPAQRLAVQEVQRQKAIKAKRDAIALAMMRNPNDPMATGGGSLGFNDMLTRS